MDENLLLQLQIELKLIWEDLKILQYYGNRIELMRRWGDLDNELHQRIIREETLEPMVPAVNRLKRHVKERLNECLYHDGSGLFDGESSKN